MNLKIISLILIVPILTTFSKPTITEKREIAKHLQEISVTIRASDGYSSSEGSGVLISREIQGENISFVWTCGHVIDHLRRVRTVIKHGNPVKVVEFPDVEIIKEIVEHGRRVGEIKMDAKVLKYSDADTGEDLALLMVRAKDYAKDSANFYLGQDNDGIIPIGTSLFHVGSLLGQQGANSMTTGIVSQVGRIYSKVEFDQTTVTAFPGSSGGGVYLEDGQYMGMLVRGAGENFNLIVPIRRMIRWAEEHDIIWALNPKEPTPTMSEILELPIETAGDEKRTTGVNDKLRDFPFLIKETYESVE